MPKVRKRHWYIVFRMGKAEPSYLINAFSESAIRRALLFDKKYYKVLPCKVWWLAKIMCGNPIDLSETTDLAPNHWLMQNEEVVYHVWILN